MSRIFVDARLALLLLLFSFGALRATDLAPRSRAPRDQPLESAASRRLLGRRGGGNPCLNQTDEECVTQHVDRFARDAFRSPSGVLKFPYLVPGGPYNQSWEWDSMFMGVALRKWGSRSTSPASLPDQFPIYSRPGPPMEGLTWRGR